MSDITAGLEIMVPIYIAGALIFIGGPIFGLGVALGWWIWG